jgi:hypothetical protein
MKTLGGLTQGYPDELAQQIAATYAGMAHFAASGPAGLRCSDCKFFGYEIPRRNRSGDVVGTARKPGCQMFFRLTQRHGPAFAGNTPSCKYLEVRT